MLDSFCLEILDVPFLFSTTIVFELQRRGGAGVIYKINDRTVALS